MDCWVPGYKLSLISYMFLCLPFFLGVAYIRDLKFLAPCSTVANFLMAGGLVIIFIYLLNDLPDITERAAVGTLSGLPLYFGTAIYAFEGIGVVSSLIHNKKLSSPMQGCL